MVIWNAELQLQGVKWKKADKSNPDGECVQLAAWNKLVAIRDSKNPTGAALIFTPAEMTAFIAGVYAGEFG